MTNGTAVSRWIRISWESAYSGEADHLFWSDEEQLFVLGIEFRYNSSREHSMAKHPELIKWLYPQGAVYFGAIRSRILTALGSCLITLNQNR